MQEFPFHFGKMEDLSLSPHSVIFDMPTGVATKETLMDVFASIIIQEDSYFFSRTWDGLSDMLEDFGWLPDELHEIVLSHADLPLSDDAVARKVYIDLLADIVKYWSHGEGSDRRVFVRFPESAKAEVVEILISDEHYEQELAAKQKQEEKHSCCGGH